MSKSTKDIISKLGPLIGLILLIIVVSILNPSFLAISNIFNVLRQVSISAIIAFGMTFVILTGGIDLSVGSTLALTGAVAASLLAGGTDPIVSMGITLILGLILGAFNGLIITKGKVAPFIATLATMTIYRGLTLVYTEGKPISGLGDHVSFQLFGKGYVLGIPVPVITMLISFCILAFILHKTTFGRRVYAVGGNEEAAKLSGINAGRVKIAVYAVSGFLAALSALILTSRLNSASRQQGSLMNWMPLLPSY